MFKKSNFSTLGSMLSGRLSGIGIKKGIDAGRMVDAYKKIIEEMPELDGSKVVSWDGKILLLGVESGLQRQEVLFKRNKILSKVKERGFKVEELRIGFLGV